MQIKKVLALAAILTLASNSTVYAASLEPNVEEIEETSIDSEEAPESDEDAEEALDIWGSDSTDEVQAFDADELDNLEESESGEETEEIKPENINTGETKPNTDKKSNKDLPKTGISDFRVSIANAISDFCYWIFSSILR